MDLCAAILNRGEAMQVELTMDDQMFLDELVEQGRYASREQAVKVGLDHLREEEENNARIRHLVEQGLESARHGRIVSQEQFLRNLAERKCKRA